MPAHLGTFAHIFSHYHGYSTLVFYMAAGFCIQDAPIASALINSVFTEVRALCYALYDLSAELCSTGLVFILLSCFPLVITSYDLTP